MSDDMATTGEIKLSREALLELHIYNLEKERDAVCAERQWLLNEKSASWPHQREHYENLYKRQEDEIAQLKRELSTARQIKRAIQNKARAADDGAMAYSVMRAERDRAIVALKECHGQLECWCTLARRAGHTQCSVCDTNEKIRADFPELFKEGS